MLAFELGFRDGFSSWILELEFVLRFRVGFWRWIFQVDSRVGIRVRISSWIFGVRNGQWFTHCPLSKYGMYRGEIRRVHEENISYYRERLSFTHTHTRIAPGQPSQFSVTSCTQEQAF